MDMHSRGQTPSVMTQCTTRRGALVLLGGTAIAAGRGPRPFFETAAGGTGDASSMLVCPASRAFPTLLVPADGTIVRTPTLVRGQRYRLHAAGFVSSNVAARLGVWAIDAGYLFAVRDGGLTQHADRLDEGPIGVVIVSGARADSTATWGAYVPTHRYQCDIGGDDQPVVLQLVIPAAWRAINGRVTVQIVCAECS